MGDDRLWWQHGVIYQIYPRSYQDANGDGVGDLEGIRQRLDHLAWLGVDALWLSPFQPSPMADFGYDVADYCGVDPLFGTLEDFDRLLTDAHARGIRVTLDWVPNHSSDQHPWFREARATRTSAKRDWYVWRDGRGDGPPNNWVSVFGGPAWQHDPATGQWYLHSFLREQPDLNWREPALVRAMHDAVRFWLDRGADGSVEDDWIEILLVVEDFVPYSHLGARWGCPCSAVVLKSGAHRPQQAVGERSGALRHRTARDP
jgi:glycosidase